MIVDTMKTKAIAPWFGGKRTLHEAAMEFLSKGKETKRESRREAVAPGR
ncbi:MAG: hypothetical protein WBL15_11605 [Phycisphaerae bacterium]